MGSIPQLSILRGETQPLPHPGEEPSLLHRLFEMGVAKMDRDAPAVISAASNLSYKQLDQLASALARSILRRAHSIGGTCNSDGDFVVAVSMSPSACLIATLLATWKSGAAILPLDPSFPKSRVQHILREAQPVLVVTDTEESEVQGLCNFAVSYRELLKESKDLSRESIPEHETFLGREPSLALVLYTSGSTGIPKGVRLPHRVLLNRLRWQWRVFPYAATERSCVFKTALTFVDSVAELWGPLLQGRSVIVVPSDVTKDPERLIAVLQHHRVERLVLVPSLLRSILLCLKLQAGTREPPLRHLKVWVCSGEPLATELATLFFERFPPGNHVLCNFYGSTEVMGDVTYHVMGEALDKHQRIPIGLPLDNTVVYLMDRQGRPVAAGEAGELYVSGLNLAQGYVSGRDPERFLDNPLALDPDYARLYRTGDYARLVNGTLMYEGRTDSQVKVRGHRVDLSEVEKAVNDVTGVDKAVVLCYKAGEVNQTLLAFVTSPRPLLALQVEAELQRTLATYQIPQVVVLDHIPLLVNGKNDRQSLLRSYEDNYVNESGAGGEKVELDYTGISKKNMAAAQTLFETIASVLGKSARSHLSAESNFYELGGNSLNSIYTVTKLRDQGYIIGISDFISASNLSDVLSRMHLESDSDSDQLIQPASQLTQYVTQPLSQAHREDVTAMITTSFLEKADLEQWLMPHVYPQDYTELVREIWEPLVRKDLSFVVCNSDGEAVGVALNFDANDEPNVEITSKLVIVFDFLEHIEGPIRDEQLPQGVGHVLHCFMMATHASLSYQQNIAVMQYMEEQVLRLATDRRFTGILTTNTSPLTQQLGEDVYGYQVLLDYQVNQYVAPDGTKPFGQAPDSQRAVCSWRPVVGIQL